MSERGTYVNLEDVFSGGVFTEEDALICAIQNIDYVKECQYTKSNIRDRYLASYGNAAEAAVKIIWGDRE